MNAKTENLVICIAREFGSGGREVGREVAKALGIEFYDKELLSHAAEKSGIMQELFETHDEKPVSGLFAPVIPLGFKPSTFNDYIAYMPNDKIQNVITDVIREAAEKSPCVIIGRCADYILRGRAKTLSVFVHAEMETRINRISRLHNLDEDSARSLIRKTDRSRANYYNFYTDREWGLAENYDLSINNGRLGAEKTVKLIVQAAELFCK